MNMNMENMGGATSYINPLSQKEKEHLGPKNSIDLRPYNDLLNRLSRAAIFAGALIVPSAALASEEQEFLPHVTTISGQQANPEQAKEKKSISELELMRENVIESAKKICDKIVSDPEFEKCLCEARNLIPVIELPANPRGEENIDSLNLTLEGKLLRQIDHNIQTNPNIGKLNENLARLIDNNEYADLLNNVTRSPYTTQIIDSGIKYKTEVQTLKDYSFDGYTKLRGGQEPVNVRHTKTNTYTTPVDRTYAYGRATGVNENTRPKYDIKNMTASFLGLEPLGKVVGKKFAEFLGCDIKDVVSYSSLSGSWHGDSNGTSATEHNNLHNVYTLEVCKKSLDPINGTITPVFAAFNNSYGGRNTHLKDTGIREKVDLTFHNDGKKANYYDSGYQSPVLGHKALITFVGVKQEVRIKDSNFYGVINFGIQNGYTDGGEFKAKLSSLNDKVLPGHYAKMLDKVMGGNSTTIMGSFGLVYKNPNSALDGFAVNVIPPGKDGTAAVTFTIINKTLNIF